MRNSLYLAVHLNEWFTVSVQIDGDDAATDVLGETLKKYLEN